MPLYKTKKTVYYKNINQLDALKYGSLQEVDGVFSGFNDNNYIWLPKKCPTNEKNWEIVIKYNTGSEALSGYKVFLGGSSDYKIAICTYSSKFYLYLSANGTSWGIASKKAGTYTVLTNTTYWVKLKRVDGAKYILSYSLDGIDYVDDITISSTYDLIPDAYRFGRSGVDSQYSTGSIDFKECYININGERWWSGYKKIAVQSTPEEYDFVQTEEAYKCVSKKEYEYFKYGTTPNVTTFGYVNNDNGVLSGFSASDYVTLPYIFSSDSFTWEVILKIKTSTLSSSTSDTNLFIGGTSAFKSGVAIYCESKVLKLSLSSNGSSWDIAKTKTGSTLSSDTDYYIRLRFTGTEYELSYRTLDSDWNIDIVVSSTTPVLQNSTWLIGSGYIGGDTRYTATGGIDFKECYININEERWWNGVKLEECTVNDKYDTKIISDKYFNMSDNSEMYATFIHPGVYTLRIAKENNFLIEAVSGGGCGAYVDGAYDSYSDTSSSYHYYANGGTGAYFKGLLKLPAGEYTVRIGAPNKTKGEYGSIIQIENCFELRGGLNGVPPGSSFKTAQPESGGRITDSTAISAIIDYRVGSDRVYHGSWKDNNGKAFDNTPSIAPANLQQYGYAGGRQSKVIQFGGGAYLSIRYNYGEIV